MWVTFQKHWVKFPKIKIAYFGQIQTENFGQYSGFQAKFVIEDVPHMLRLAYKEKPH